MIKDLENLVVGKCKNCDGAGIIKNKECSCVSLFRILSGLKLGNFPEEFVLIASENSLENTVEVMEGERYWNFALENFDDFIERGLGLVLYGEDVEFAASYLVFKLLEIELRISISWNNLNFNQDDVVVYSFENSNLSRENLCNILERRKKSLLCSILCLEGDSLKELSQDLRLAEILGYEKGVLTGGVFRACKVKVDKPVRGWKI